MSLLKRKSTKSEAESPQNAVTVRFLDDSEPLTVTFQKEHSGQWLFEKVCEELNLLEKDYFGLRYVDGEKQRHWLNPAKTIYRQLRGQFTMTLSFRVKYYPPDPSKLQEEVTRYFLFLQVRRDLQSGRLMAPPNVLHQLAAYVVQGEVGDYDPQDHPEGYISQHKLLPRQPEEVEREIHDLHKNISGQVPGVAEANFLERSSHLPTYGVDPHPTKDWEGRSLLLGTTHEGIVTFHGGAVVQRIAWPDVHKLGFDGKHFQVHTISESDTGGSLNTSTHSASSPKARRQTISFKCGTPAAAKHLWKCALETQAFFTISVSSSVPKVHSGGFFRGSKFRYSGRCLTELAPEYERNKREDPDFVRSPSRTALMNAHKQPSLQSEPLKFLLETHESPQHTKHHDAAAALPNGDHSDVDGGKPLNDVGRDIPVITETLVGDKSEEGETRPVRTLTSSEVYSQPSGDVRGSRDDVMTSSSHRDSSASSGVNKGDGEEAEEEKIEREEARVEEGPPPKPPRASPEEDTPTSSATSPPPEDDVANHASYGTAPAQEAENTVAERRRAGGVARWILYLFLLALFALVALVIFLEYAPKSATRMPVLKAVRELYRPLKRRLRKLW